MEHALTTAEGVAAVVIAVYVAFVGTFQWITARDKLRLDLYNRRFEVYASTITYMQTVMDGQASTVSVKERMTQRIMFVRGMLESSFLFADTPSITVLLEEFNSRSFEMNGFISRFAEPKSVYLPDFPEQSAINLANVKWCLAARNQLRTMLEPYLAFRHREFRRSFQNVFRRTNQPNELKSNSAEQG